MARRTCRFGLFLILTALFISGLDARPTRSSNIPSPPVPPLAIGAGASRGLMLHPGHRVHSTVALPNPVGDTVILPLSAGLTTISLPLRTDSGQISDIFSNLPDGSRIWTWDATEQKFVEGFDQSLTLGQGALLYVPSPTVIVINGNEVPDSEVPVDLKPGWNLVGVPYAEALPRSAQSVYVDSVQVALNDAVDNGSIGPSIYSIDTNGQNPIGDDEAFQPMSAYWVYSNGADMLELRPLSVQLGAFAGWFARSIGSIGLNFIAQELMAKWADDPNAEVLQQLSDISGQIQAIDGTLSNMQGQLNSLSTQIDIAKTDILIALGDQPVQQVEAALNVNFRQDSGLDKSLASFVKAAQTADGAKKVTADIRTQFALKVINDFDYLTKFSAVQGAILPTTGTGVLDKMAEKITLEKKAAVDKGQTPPSAWDSYRAFEAYFNRLIGIQVECMILITNAREQLATVPQYAAVNKGLADSWRQGVYAPAIQAEAERFRSLVEDQMMRNLNVTSGAGVAAVSVPNIYRDKIIPRMDFILMNLLNEQPGLRVRYLGTPQMSALNPYRVDMTIGDGRSARSALMAPPRADSGSWKPQTGYVPYDSWYFSANSELQFSVAKDWLVYKQTVPICSAPSDSCLSPNRYAFFMYDTVGLDGPRPDDQAAERSLGHGVSTVVLQTIDGTANGDLAPSPTGTLFGSIILAKRPTAGTALHLFGRFKNFTNQGCSAQVIAGIDFDFVGVSNCGNAVGTLTQSESFTYTGAAPGLKSTGTVTLGVRFRGTNDYRGSVGWTGIYTSGGAEQASVKNNANETMAVVTTPGSVTWVPGQKYFVQLGVQSSKYQVCPVYRSCENKWPGTVFATRGPVGFTIDQ